MCDGVARQPVRSTPTVPSRNAALRALARASAVVLGLSVVLAPAMPVAVVGAGLAPTSGPASGTVSRAGPAPVDTPGRARPYIVVMRRSAADSERGSARTQRRTRSRLVSRAIGRSVPGVTVHHRYTSAMGGFAADLTPTQVQRLEADPAVARVLPDAPIEASAVVVPGPPSVAGPSGGVSDAQSTPVGIRRIGGAAWSDTAAVDVAVASIPASGRAPTRRWVAS